MLRSIILCGALVAVEAGSVRIGANGKEHLPTKSSGCGKSSPYSLGKTSVATGKFAGVTWTYRVYVPKSYNKNTPMPVIVHHPGWGMSASQEEKGAGITLYADSKGFISVTAQGGNDNSHSGGPWYSWNAVGSTQSPGKAGATCTSYAGTSQYCYSSCACKDSPQCDWTTCYDTVTPTGTGTSSVIGFIPSLFDSLEGQLCIDTTREYASGESNGGMMTYQLGVDMHQRLAAISPEFGSFHKGFSMSPATGVPVIDLHGSKDTTVPANVSLSGDGWYYTTTAQIFGGDSYSYGWKYANGCSGKSTHYVTPFDGQSKFYCVSEGTCSGGDVVRCMWNGGHNWLFNSATSNGAYVTDFLLQWAKLTHAGMGGVVGETPLAGAPLTDVRVLNETEAAAARLAEEELSSPARLPSLLTSSAGKKAHYGNPTDGCLDDEDVLLVGSGVACSPKIGSTASTSSEDKLPVPKCTLGGYGVHKNGCPADADVSKGSKAFSVCIAKDNTTDPYTNGNFHCVLGCPCSGAETCGAAADAHCPSGAVCERGELRNGAYGVCTYKSSNDKRPPLAAQAA
jgi:polyhydroxybutyrate depolymerase